MRDERLNFGALGLQNKARVLRLSGPLTISTLYKFQDMARSDSTASLVLDFTNVPYVDSAGVGAMVGAYVRHQKAGHSVTLEGADERARTTLQVTQLDGCRTHTHRIPQAAS